MNIFKKRSIWVLIAIYTAFWLAASIVAGFILDGYKNTINSTLNILDYRTETLDTGEKIDSEYYKSAYVKKDANGISLTETDENGYEHQIYDDAALREASLAKADEVQREGATLLWNTSNGLPLKSGNKVSLFSHSSVDYVYSGSGSANARTNGAPTMKTALEAAGLSVNPTLWDFYKSGDGSSYQRTDRRKINEVPWSKYSSTVTDSFSQYGDAAIVVLSRRLGEGSVASGGALDATQTSADTASGDYFDMSSQEIKMLEEVIAAKKNRTFGKVIVLLNTPTALNFTDLMKYREDIDSCMWIGQGGWEGLNEVGRILAGTSVPSGHLPDTFAYSGMSAPAAVNSNYSYYTNANDVGLKNIGWQGTYLVYAENIYVGYKYYETRYEDAVLGRYNAGGTAGAVASAKGWSYGEEVAFPFGYGASYTQFAYSDFNCEAKGDDYEVTLTVTNTGESSGAEAVQVYIQKPYTEKEGVEQAAVNLCGYAKTAVLAPGASEEVTIAVDGSAFRTYDAEDKKTYIYEAGDYYITAAEDAHAAVNHILAAKGKTPANTNGVMDAAGNADLVWHTYNANEDDEKFSESEFTSNPITNRLDEADWNKYSHSDGTKVTYLSRKDWQNTYPTAMPQLSITQEMASDLGWNKEVEADPADTMPLYEQPRQFNLIDLKGQDYDHSAWEQLLNQLSLEEQIELLGNAYHGTVTVASINKPKDVAEDGPMGVRKQYKTSSEYTLSFPSNVLLAASFNDRLAEEVGELLGEDMLHAGVHGLYGPSANLHRTVYGGRSFEYYSEDGFLSGMMAKAQVIGIQSTGCYVNMKHYALNDQETNRYGVAIWANEQSIREIYLTAFEFASAEADLTGIMSSFTRVGAVWSGANKGMMTDILRGEWGFEGFVVSDCAWRDYMGVVDGVMAGNDCILDEGTDLAAYREAETNATVAQAMRESTHRILYVIVNSNAMNSFSANTQIIPIRVWWQNLVLGVQIGFGVLTAAAVCMAVLSFVFHDKLQRQELQKAEEKNALGGTIKENDPDRVYASGRFDGSEEENSGDLAPEESFDGGSGGQPARPRMPKKRIIQIAVAVVLAAAIVITAIAVPLALGSSDPQENISGTGDVSENPDDSSSSGSSGGLGDELEGDLVRYIFEAETPFSVEGTNTELRFDTEGKTLEDTNNPSGGAFVSRLTSEGTAILTYKVHAESNTRAVLSLCFGRTGVERSLSAIFNITVNGQPCTPAQEVVFGKYENVQYYDWQEKEVAIVDLQAGDNTIVFTKNTSGLNFDYFALASAVELSEAEEQCQHVYTEYTVVTMPTSASTGTATASCEKCRQVAEIPLPVLSEENGYECKVTVESGETTFGQADYTYRPESGGTVSFHSWLLPTGTVYTQKFEAENGTMGGSAKASADASAMNPSGGQYCGNISANQSSVTITIDSDREADVLLRMCIGTRNDKDITFDKITLTVNDAAAELPSDLVIKYVNSSFNWYNWNEYDIAVIHLKEGKNVITFANDSGTFSNIDYFTLIGTAQTNWYSEE